MSAPDGGPPARLTAGHARIAEEPRPFLTVFTPAFNRRHTLGRLFESLLNQRDSDFEWLIIDDGSTDDTRSLVENWIREGSLRIRYYYQENRGKHIAWNRASELARGRVFACVDSDDATLPEFVERIRHHWGPARRDNPKMAGIAYLYQGGPSSSARFDLGRPHLDAHFADFLIQTRCLADVGFALDSEVIRLYRFSTEFVRLYVPETVLLFEVDREHTFRFVNERLAVYHWAPDDSSRLSSRPSMGSADRASALSLLLLNQSYIDNCLRLLGRYGWLAIFWDYPIAIARRSVHFTRFAAHAGVGPVRALRRLADRRARWLVLCLMPLGYLVWLADRALLRR